MNEKKNCDAAHTLDELLSYYDERFVYCAYHTLLDRAPDQQGLLTYLSRIRVGYSKMDILTEIRQSSEGKKHPEKLNGFDKAIKKYRRKRWLLFGTRSNDIANELQMKIRSFENTIYLSQTTSTQRYNNLINELGRIEHAINVLSKQTCNEGEALLQTEVNIKLLDDYDAISLSGLFDTEFYLQTYQDIDSAFINPLEHYLSYGFKEGRNPSPRFDTSFYLSNNQDVLDCCMNPLLHYVLHGQKEGRETFVIDAMQDFLDIIPLFDDKPHIKSFKTDKPIDIVIPVYNGYDYLIPLFNSIVKNSSMPYRLIIINDCSSDKRVNHFLEEFKISNPLIKMVLINNENNLGFVKSINKAVKRTINHFVLLNTDTEVPPLWLERLMYPIFEMKNIASTTPFTNAGTIFSFPEYLKDNPIYENLKIEEIDSFFQYVNFDKTYIEVPTGVGFCMGINKNVVNNIGMFDEVFGKGYSEENDWSQRAIKINYKHIHVTNLFVYHKHGGSFSSEEKKILQERNLKILSDRHPSYSHDVASFVKEDKLHHLRKYLAKHIHESVKRNNFVNNIEINNSPTLYYIGHMLSHSGVGEAARGNIKAIEYLGINCITFDLSEYDWVEKLYKSCMKNLPSYVVFHLTANELLSVTKCHEKKILNIKLISYTIGVWAWESDMPSKDFLEASKYVDEVWAVSSYMLNALKDLNIKKTVVHHVVEKKNQPVKVNLNLQNLRKKYKFLVGYICDLNSYAFRKNPLGVMNAFCQAFGGNNKVALILKISGGKTNPKDLNAIRLFAKDFNNIYIYEDYWTEGEMLFFYNCIDLYLALFRSEGFGLTIAEAMLNGIPVICPKYSGVTDFAVDGVFYIDYKKIPIPEDWGPYKKGWLWADANYDEAALLLLYLFENRRELKLKTIKGKEEILNNLSRNKISSLIRNSLVQSTN